MFPRKKGVTYARGKHVKGVMNELETAWSQELQKQKDAGEIEWFSFEPWAISLAPKTTLTPDFVVMTSDGLIKIQECKGHWEEDAWVKFKMGVAKLPVFQWEIITRPRKKEPFIVEPYPPLTKAEREAAA